MTCGNCDDRFVKSSNELNRQIKNGRTEFFCSLSCSSTKLKTTTQKITAKCLWCKKEFETTTHKKARKCCNDECSHKYSQSKVNPEIHRKSLKRNSVYPKLKTFKCVVCNKPFKKKIKSKTKIYQTCGEDCLLVLLSTKSIKNPNCGGETGYKHFQYKNIWMDSSWEVELATFLDSKQIEWERDRKKHMFWWVDNNGTSRRYYPDFYLPKYNLYLDPKNKYKMKNDELKIKSVVELNRIKLICGSIDDVKKQLDFLLN